MKPIALLAMIMLISGCSAKQEAPVAYEVVAAYGHGLPGAPDHRIIIPDAPTRLPRIIKGCGVALSDVRVEFASEGMLSVLFEVLPKDEGQVLACVRERLPKGASVGKSTHP